MRVSRWIFLLGDHQRADGRCLSEKKSTGMTLSNPEIWNSATFVPIFHGLVQEATSVFRLAGLVRFSVLMSACPAGSHTLHCINIFPPGPRLVSQLQPGHAISCDSSNGVLSCGGVRIAPESVATTGIQFRRNRHLPSVLLAWGWTRPAG